jgi:hypothetical protein
MTKSKNTGRMFHSLTNMPRNQRKYLKHIDGLRLGELDAKNAQLVLLAHLFNDDEVFNDAVYGGEFYNMMADEMGVDISNDANKKEFKRKFFNSILFNENNLVVANSKYGKAFKKLFPITYYHLIEMQTETSKANELQRSESNLFIDNITRDLVNEGLFVIPIHDAITFDLDEIDQVQKIIDDNCYSVLGRLITLSLEEFCPTIDNKCTTYNNLYNKSKAEGEEEKDSHEGVYVVQNNPMVGQNKKTLLKNEKVAIITKTIKELKADNQKITIRKVQELSGVAKATVEKHYKAIIADLSHDNNEDKQSDVLDNKTLEIAHNNDKLIHKKIALEERFKSVVNGIMIVPDLISVLGSKTTNKIPIANWSELIRNVNQDGFEMFWDNLQNYKNGLSCLKM